MDRLEVKMAGSVPEFYLYADIGTDYDGVSADEFTKALATVKNSKELSVRINSQGGDVFEAYAMYGALKRYPGKVTMHVDGLAASAASYLLMAGDRIMMADNALVMIHEPHSRGAGTASELENKATMLRKITGTVVDAYAKRTGNSPDDILSMMVAETWMDATESKARGFADEVVGGMKVAAHVDPNRFQRTPTRLIVSDGKAAEEYRRRLAAFQSKER
jgi:ATP-dependent Clp protease protease subunit